jgi:hypothetical protein
MPKNTRQTRIGLDNRHQDKNGRIDRKHGNTRIDTLRNEYPHLAPGMPGDMLLDTYLQQIGASSLSEALHKKPWQPHRVGRI